MPPVHRSESLSSTQAFTVNAPGYAIGGLALYVGVLTLIVMVIHLRKKSQKTVGQVYELDVVGCAEVCRYEIK
jgi:hypothetical protein